MLMFDVGGVDCGGFQNVHCINCCVCVCVVCFVLILIAREFCSRFVCNVLRFALLSVCVFVGAILLADVFRLLTFCA